MLKLLILFALLGLNTAAHADLVLDQNQTAIPLAGHMAAWVDVDASAGAEGSTEGSIEAIASGHVGTFTPVTDNFLGGIGKERSLWLRFTLTSTAPRTTEWVLRILPTYLDHVDLYQPEAGGWVKIPNGDALPFAARPLDDRAAAFRLKLNPDEPRTFYLHLRHGGFLNVYPMLYTPAAYQRVLMQESLIFGLYFGVALLFLLVNLGHWITLRELIFLEFSVYLAVRGLYFLTYDGLAYQWLLPNDPVFLQDALRLLLIGSVASIAPILVRVLNLREHYPRLATLCWGLGGMAALLTLSVFTGQFTRFGGLLSLIVLLFGLMGAGVAAVQIRHRQPLGWLILLAMVMMLVGLGTSALASFGISSGVFWDVYGGQIASFATFLSLHFAVTQRMVRMKQEKAASERSARLAHAMAEKERAARREQADFFAMLFHEIKTPLAEIASSATVLEQLDDGGHRESASRYDTIHRAVDRMNLMLEQNLARDRLELAETHLTCRPLEPAALARLVVDSFRGAHPQTLTLDAPPFLPCLDGDPEFLRVALVNLIDNAIKYAPAHSEIRVQVAIAPGGIAFIVRDEGPGMNAKTKARVFDRYWRGDIAGTVAGNGLGLYLVRRIAAAHGGSITLDSTLGQGSRFTLFIPLSPMGTSKNRYEHVREQGAAQ